jgi:sigma-E factor negative regulatory protein RseB
MRFLLFYLLFISSAFASEGQNLTGSQWLRNVSDAMKTLGYHGTVVLMKNGQIDTMKYQHSVENGIETERLISLNTPLREITRNSGEISCLYKETSQKVESDHPVDRSFIVNLPLHAEQISEQYLLAVAGQEMIAMRPAQIIAILPKDNLRYARKLWVDTATSLPLKVEVYGLDGNILEQVLFTELAVDDNSTSSQTQQNVPSQHLHEFKVETFGNSAYQLKSLPAGFEKMFFIRTSMQQSNKQVDHLLISDGFSNISIYFEAKGIKGIEGLRSLGPVNSYSRVIGDVQITVMGEVPMETIQLVANSVDVR